MKYKSNLLESFSIAAVFIFSSASSRADLLDSPGITTTSNAPVIVGSVLRSPVTIETSIAQPFGVITTINVTNMPSSLIPTREGNNSLSDHPELGAITSLSNREEAPTNLPNINGPINLSAYPTDYSIAAPPPDDESVSNTPSSFSDDPFKYSFGMTYRRQTIIGNNVTLTPWDFRAAQNNCPQQRIEIGPKFLRKQDPQP